MQRYTAATVGLCLALSYFPAHSAEQADEPPKLLGRCSTQQLEEEPFAEWFRENYDGYAPHPEVLRSLGDTEFNGVEMTLFFGTWCGDSRREVPRILRLLDELGLSGERIGLVAVDAGEGVHKQSPGGEERGLEIYRVPTLQIRRNGKEIARLVEFPVLSLERDLLAILSGAAYEPNYRSYPVIRDWLDKGFLSDENVSARGLAQQVQGLIATEGELAAAASVLLERGDAAQAVKLHAVNCALHPKSARCFARLAEARLRAGDAEDAHEAAKRALELNEDPQAIADLVDLLERSRAPTEIAARQVTPENPDATP